MKGNSKSWKPAYWVPSSTDLSDEQIGETLASMKDSGLSALFLKNCTKLGNKSIEAIAGYRGLNALDLTNSSINDDAGRLLRRCRSLRTLVVAGTEIGNPFIAALGRMPRIEVLGLSATQVQDDGVALFSRLFPRVWSLGLNDTSISDRAFPALRAMPQLSKLGIRATATSWHGIIDHLAGKLDEIELSEIYIGSDLKPLSQLGNVISLYAAATAIGNDACAVLSTFSNLRHLSVARNPITDWGAHLLVQSPSIRTLNLEGTCVTKTFRDGLASRPHQKIAF